MTHIVTGAAGFIGSHLTERLVADGADVVGIDDFHPYYDEAIKRDNVRQVEAAAESADGTFRLVEGSITDDEALDRLPSAPEWVFHLAAIAGVRYSVDHPVPYTEINVLGTTKLIDSLADAEKFVVASSSSVYGEVPLADLPVSEDREPAPIAPYPLSKVQTEEVTRMLCDGADIPYAILRFFSVYGPRQRPDEAFTKFVSRALAGETIPVYGDGHQSRDFTHVSDVVSGTVRAAEHGEGAYNLGSGRRVTVNDMVATLDDILGGVDAEHVEQPPGDAEHTHADVSKARSELGYEPGIDFREGAESCVTWCRRMADEGLL
jgi:UDP-glucose 4-epimerase